MGFRYRVRRRAVTTGAGLLALGFCLRRAPERRCSAADLTGQHEDTDQTRDRHRLEKRSFDNVFAVFQARTVPITDASTPAKRSSLKLLLTRETAIPTTRMRPGSKSITVGA